MRRGVIWYRVKSKTLVPFLAVGLVTLVVAQLVACGDATEDAFGVAADNGPDAGDAHPQTGILDATATAADAAVAAVDADLDPDEHDADALADAGFDAGHDAGFDAGADAGTSTAFPMTRTKIGAPLWEIVDCQQFSAVMGDPADNYLEFDQTSDAMLSPGHVFNDMTFAYDPGVPHGPPYTSELSAASTRLGFTSAGHFKPAAFSGRNGIYFTCMIAPSVGAPTGSSSDFANGPILPKTLFPVSSEGGVYRNGVLFDPEVDFSFTTVSSGTGISHAPLGYADNMSYAPQGVVDPRGAYEWRLHIRDANGVGWDLIVPFTVAD